jgi:hypothetical protein
VGDEVGVTVEVKCGPGQPTAMMFTNQRLDAVAKVGEEERIVMGFWTLV